MRSAPSKTVALVRTVWLGAGAEQAAAASKHAAIKR